VIDRPSGDAAAQAAVIRAGDLPPRLRLPLLLLAALSLLLGIGAGLVRLGWEPVFVLAPLTGAHGPLMVGGFLGTVIALERAVANGRRWAYLGPLLCGSGGLALLLGLPQAIIALALGAGSGVLLAVSIGFWRLQRNQANATVAAGAAAWLVGNLAWLGGASIPQLVPWWMAFVVLTVAGERLELSRYLPVSPQARRLYPVALLVLLVGLLLGHFWPVLGGAAAALGLLAVTAWLARHDVARFNVRRPGLPRFAALAIGNGYAWLVVAALAWLIGTPLLPGTLTYDIALHALFVGFVFSMIFAHAPIVFPAVVGISLPFHNGLYVPLVLLDLSLLLRFVGDLAALPALRIAGGLGHAVAIVLFVVMLLGGILHGRWQRSVTDRPTSEPD